MGKERNRRFRERPPMGCASGTGELCRTGGKDLFDLGMYASSVIGAVMRLPSNRDKSVNYHLQISANLVRIGKQAFGEIVWSLIDQPPSFSIRYVVP
jgi:hypothetical protein